MSVLIKNIRMSSEVQCFSHLHLWANSIEACIKSLRVYCESAKVNIISYDKLHLNFQPISALRCVRAGLLVSSQNRLIASCRSHVYTLTVNFRVFNVSRSGKGDCGGRVKMASVGKWLAYVCILKAINQGNVLVLRLYLQSIKIQNRSIFVVMCSDTGQTAVYLLWCAVILGRQQYICCDVQWYWADRSIFVLMSANWGDSLGTGKLDQIS